MKPKIKYVCLKEFSEIIKRFTCLLISIESFSNPDCSKDLKKLDELKTEKQIRKFAILNKKSENSSLRYFSEYILKGEITIKSSFSFDGDVEFSPGNLAEDYMPKLETLIVSNKKIYKIRYFSQKILDFFGIYP